jgi:thiol-disulfide isomerase/thioredoxin
MKGKSSFLLMAGVAIVVVLSALGAVYGIRTLSGNAQIAGTCNSAPATAQRLAGLNHGAVAAFQLAEQAQFIGDLVFSDENGNATGLADHRGQYVLLNLWATWCAPCREEMPALKNLQNAMGSDRFQVLPVSVDLGDPDKPLAFYEEHNLAGLPFRFDGTMSIFQQLKRMSIAFGLPATVLVDPQGCVLGSMNGPADWAGDDAKALIEAAIHISED